MSINLKNYTGGVLLNQDTSEVKSVTAGAILGPLVVSTRADVAIASFTAVNFAFTNVMDWISRTLSTFSGKLTA